MDGTPLLSRRFAMPRRLFPLAAIAIALLAVAGAAQDAPQKGVIKKVDVAGESLILGVDGKDVTVYVGPKTLMKGADDQELADRLKSPELKAGRAVMFITQSQDGKPVLRGIKLIGDAGAAPKGERVTPD